MNLINIITIAPFVILGGLLILTLVFNIRNQRIKKHFIKAYQLENVSNRVKIRKKTVSKTSNYFKLRYPSWLYCNKDGTRDKRRNGNRIIWNNSSLYIDEYIVETKNPYMLVQLVNQLRQRNENLSIEKCVEELKKYNQIAAQKEFINKCNNIQNIIDKFAEKPTAFEDFSAELFTKMGYQAKTTKQTNDGGYDIELFKDGEKTIVECKCYSLHNKIGRPLVQKLVGANQVENADRMIFLSTSDYSKEAYEYAKNVGVEMINGDKLIELLNKYSKIEKTVVEIAAIEWQLNKNDILIHVPKDIHIYI